MTNDQKAKVDVMATLFTRVAVGLTLAGVMWLATSVSSQGEEIAVVKERVNTIASRLGGFDSLNSRLSTIEANRFTAANGLELWKELAAIKGVLPSTFPPPETDRRLRALETAVLELRDK